MAAIPTVSELWKTGTVTDPEIDAAVDAYLANPKADPFRFSCGHAIDVAAAVHAYLPARTALADPDRTPLFRRTMVRTAILLARPVQG